MTVLPPLLNGLCFIGKLHNDNLILSRITILTLEHVLSRHADRTVQLWMQRLKDSSSTKRLSLMYLANGKQLFEPDLHHTHMYIRMRLRLQNTWELVC